MATPPFLVKALHDYLSPEEDDLKFKSNQIITVTDEEDADWYYGEYEDDSGTKLEGLFPRNFVKIFEPEPPPRPVRAGRAKKDTEAHPPPQDAALPEPATAPPPITAAPEPATTQSVDALSPSSPTPKEPETSSIPPPSETGVTKPQISTISSKPAPPPVTEKPASNAFRDRINAFNRPAAAPVAPVKPGGLGGSGFVKKPFVAPPPSKNAYIPPPREPPPQKVYRREEDLALNTQTEETGQSEVKPQPVAGARDEDEEDQPKPTSLKERIALLQKQQMEQAARHAEKTKRPKKVPDAEEPYVGQEDVATDAPEEEHILEMADKVEDDVAHPARIAKDQDPVRSPVMSPPRELFSDGNDADESGAADTAEGEETSTGRDDSDEQPNRRSIQPPAPPRRPPEPPEASIAQEAPVQFNTEREDRDSEDGEDEDDVDPEVKRRMEIRERMAKMSGGMGMAGMFGPPGGLPSRSSAKPKLPSGERKDSAASAKSSDSPSSRAPPIPVMAMPGMQKSRSPEQAQPSTSFEEPRDIEDIDEDIVQPQRRSTDRSSHPSSPQDRPAPPPPPHVQTRTGPTAFSERAPLPPPASSRPVPPPPPLQREPPSGGSESDDEMSSHDQRSPGRDPSWTADREGQPAPPMTSAPSIPQRIQTSETRPFEATLQDPTGDDDDDDSVRRRTNAPPVPTTGPPVQSAPQNRAPPPPPPAAAGLARPPTSGPAPIVPEAQAAYDESDDEVTEYDGDYDTDIASGIAHKDALKAHARGPSTGDESTAEESSLHHSRLPSVGPLLPSNAPRAVPPPPPQQPPHNKRQSSEMPRAAPPPPPPPKQDLDDESEDYDPYRYSTPAPARATASSSRRAETQMPVTPRVEEPEPSFSPSSPQHRRAPSASQNAPQYPSSPLMSAPGTSNPRQSSDMQRTSATIRRSTDVARPSGEHFMANDVDLSESSRWWAQANAPPPIFQNRRDIIYEIDQNSTTRRGGKKSITKDVYVLYMDYSQTIVSAHFEATDPGTATLLEQRHESPPRIPRQDQLEAAHSRFGAHIVQGTRSREGGNVGDGSPHALALQVVSALPDALLPVGVRAYGAVVYANLANASVQQYDEIRAGDIVTFRNTKFGGHRGPMKSKYSVEIGKPDHVGVVVDWDGTKKKVRAWEQGRESKKVKIESFKFGDLKSGEVKVWRVMDRGWVGWEGTN